MSGQGAVRAVGVALPSPWWRRNRGWHVLHLVGCLVTVPVLALTTVHGARLGVAVVGVLTLVAAYGVRGGRGFAADPPGSTVYPVLAWCAAIMITVGSYQAGTVCAFLVVTQTWALMERTAATWLVTAGFVVFGAVIWLWSGADTKAFLVVLATVGGGWAFAVCMGWFVDSIARTSQERAEIIDTLRATQAELARSQRLEGIHAERERLSGEIHDTLAQGFTSVVALSRAAQLAQERGDGARVAERLRLIETTAQDNLDEARIIVAELSAVSSHTLVQALERLVHTIRQATAMEGRLDVMGPPQGAGPAVETALLRIAQECLTNSRKHSGATMFGVTLDYTRGDCITLCTSDDGVGFNPAAAPLGFGLGGIRSRADAVGGQVDLQTGPGRGTRLSVRVPR
ncbi:ATP-binding protein [Allobranchiibius huperziae]|uniref:Signal transduction histidine kinase n=1 Tax=Allobranchiibius huperziae TaxID=1874116 RepID=A0A853DM57_9MICO|nr:signal transduction histidine kinase [Allobranchiibius huperziae]